MKKLIFITAVLFLSSCVPDMAPPKTVMKSLMLGDTEIEWCSGSSSYVTVPDYITIKRGNVIDTIGEATNVADIKTLGANNLLIGFYGPLQLYDVVIEFPKRILDYTIVIDTIFSKQY